MPNEMNHAEVSMDKVLEVLDYLAENGSTICMDGELYNNLFVALNQAATDERRIANGELVEVIHGRWIMKPLPMPNDPPNVEPWNVRYYCSNCDFTTGPTTANYCPDCGARLDGKDGGEK